MKNRVALSLLFAGLCTLVFVPTAAPPVLAQGGKFLPTVSKAVKSDRSSPLTQLRAPAATARVLPHLPLRKPTGSPPSGRPAARDPLLSNQFFRAAMPSPSQSFEGISAQSDVSVVGFPPLPPDPNGDIGFDPASGKRYYVQWNNIVFAIWDVTNTPTLVFGPVAGNTPWSGMDPCGGTNAGDPIVLFDPFAQRWLLSQFSFHFSGPNPVPPFYQCIAISTSGNPMGSYNRYQFLMSSTLLNDYPKFGVWPDAYYMSTNQFNGNNFVGARATAFERAKMLTGDPSAQMVTFDESIINSGFGGQLPSDFDGLMPPPVGAPNYFVEVDQAGTLSKTHDALGIWQFHVDWANPLNSTFGNNGQPNQILTVAAFNLMPCTFSNSGCVPQPLLAPMLDPIGDRVMNRLQYRKYLDHESLVTNHTVDAGGSPTGHAGVRWYELRQTGSGWSIHQQGTFAPDSSSRWLGSVAADAQGNIAVGYSLSSTSVFPSVAYTGRLATDPLGSLPQAEVTLMAGSGAQFDASARWGDYSMLAVDPVDDCTFWYTNEYYTVSGQRTWQTRIGAFRFPSCFAIAGPFNLFLPFIAK